MQNFPNTYKLYANEITLPVYNGLKEDSIKIVIEKVIEAYEHIITKKRNKTTH